MKEHHHIWRPLFAAVAVLALVATACGPTAPTGGASPTPTGEEPADQPVAGGRIVEGIFSDIKTLNPVLVTDCPSCYPTDLMYLGLISADPETDEPTPDLASWEVSSDGLTYTWTMDPDAVWSDGKPVLAEDYLTGVKAVGKSAATVRKSNFQDVEGFTEFADGEADEITGIKIDPNDPKKWTVQMKVLSCPALFDISGYYVLPTHIYGKYVTADSTPEDFDTAPENTAPPVVNGPFKFKEWRAGDQVILARNENYFKGAPLLEEYVFKVVADQTVLAAQLKTGELNVGTVPPAELADIEAQEHLKVVRYMSPGFTYIGWRVDSPNPGAAALADKRVRQALAYGLDMAAILENVAFGEGLQHFQYSLPISWAASPNVSEYSYDPAKAEQLLQEAGYTKGADGFYQKDGVPIQLSIVTNSGNKVREALVQIAAEQYQSIGVNITSRTEAFQTLVPKLTGGSPEIEAVTIGWTGLTGDPDPYQIWHSSQVPDPAAGVEGFGFTGFKNAAMDEAIEEGRNPSDGDCSVAARSKWYHQFNEILNEEQPYNFGLILNTLHVAAKNLENFAPTTFAVRYNVHEWWFREE